jgi:hypothetical protein
MKKKWWLALAALIVIALLLAIGVPLLLPPTPGVTYANYSRLEKGMPREDVHAILGTPSNARGNFDVWQMVDGDRVRVHYDGNGLVDELEWNHSIDERTSLERLRDRVPFLAHPPPPRFDVLNVW